MLFAPGTFRAHRRRLGNYRPGAQIPSSFAIQLVFGSLVINPDDPSPRQFQDFLLRSFGLNFARGIRAEIFSFPLAKTVVAKYRPLGVSAALFLWGFPLTHSGVGRGPMWREGLNVRMPVVSDCAGSYRIAIGFRSVLLHNFRIHRHSARIHEYQRIF